jgi:hypothetical protein
MTSPGGIRTGPFRRTSARRCSRRRPRSATVG